MPLQNKKTAGTVGSTGSVGSAGPKKSAGTPGKKNKAARLFVASAVLLCCFLVFTFLILQADVGAIGPGGEAVGCSTVNEAVFRGIGVHPVWKTVTDLLGVFAIAVGCVFACVGAYQLLTRKSLWKVDPELLAAGVFYILLGVLYALFEVLALNVRPVAEGGAAEASYPSSHTLLTVCVMGSVALLAEKYLPPRFRAAVRVAAGVVAVFAVAGRLLSGFHWFTDVVGGVLLSAALLTALRGVFLTLRWKRRQAGEK